MGRELECPLGASSPRVGRVEGGHHGSFRKLFWEQIKNHPVISCHLLPSFPGLLSLLSRPLSQEMSEQSASHIMTVTTYHLLANLPQTLSFSLSSLPSSTTTHGSPWSPKLTGHHPPSTYLLKLPLHPCPPLTASLQGYTLHVPSTVPGSSRQKAEDGACHWIQPSWFTHCPPLGPLPRLDP